MKFSYRDFKISVNDVSDFLLGKDIYWNQEIDLILGSKSVSSKDFGDESFIVKLSSNGNRELKNAGVIINPIAFLILDWKKLGVNSVSFKDIVMEENKDNYLKEDLSKEWISFLLAKYKNKYRDLIENSMKVEIYDTKKEIQNLDDKLDTIQYKYTQLINKYEEILSNVNIRK